MLTHIQQISFVIVCLKFLSVNSDTVALDDGIVQGYLKESYDGRTFLAFEGIPYAQPPIGNLRLKPPQKVIKWTETLVANKTYICLQIIQQYISGTEDCLYLNVYVPRKVIRTTDNLPVLVHFHGGGYMAGDPNTIAGPSKFMDKEVVYVNANYRVGVLGFFSTGDEVISGNFGLKDQNFVLQWVQNNIDKFGGDKECVTIIGMSAGGTSVHYHYFSALSHGLFHRGISQSGTALDPASLKTNPQVLREKYLRDINCTLSDSREVLECIQAKNEEELLSPVGSYVSKDFLPLAPFGPVLEVQHENAFLTSKPLELLEGGTFYDAPYLITLTNQEAIFPTVYFKDNLEYLNSNWTEIAPLLFEYQHFESDEQYKVSARILAVFFENGNITDDNFKSFVTLSTKILWDLGAEKAALLHAIGSKSNVYLLKFAYGGDVLTWDTMMNQKLDLGIGHGEDSRFYYDNIYHNPVLTENEVKLKNTLLDVIVDFARYGIINSPEANWEPVGHEQPIKFLMINGPTDFDLLKSTNEMYEIGWNKVLYGNGSFIAI